MATSEVIRRDISPLRRTRWHAALARAVIGGLLFATPTTLLFVPCLFAWLRTGANAGGGAFKEQLP